MVVQYLSFTMDVLLSQPPVANACSPNQLGLLINTGSGQPENMEGLRDLIAEISLQANIIVCLLVCCVCGRGFCCLNLCLGIIIILNV